MGSAFSFASTIEGRMRDRVAAARRARGLRGDAAGGPSNGGVRAGISRRRSTSTLEPLEARVLMSSVAGRMVFYNHSAFDGDDVNANAQDVGAIATDKAALLPGQTAGFANYTSYNRGINGVAIDIAAGAGAAAPGDLGLQDLAFKVGTGPTRRRGMRGRRHCRSCGLPNLPRRARRAT